MAKIKRIHHVAILSADLDQALEFWQDALGMQVAQVEELPREQSKVAFLPLGGSEVEIVQPITADSGLARFLEKRGPGMHHVCLEVDDLDGMLEQLEGKQVQLINRTPVVAADGKRYVFIHPKSAGGVLVELYELSPGLTG